MAVDGFSVGQAVLSLLVDDSEAQVGANKFKGFMGQLMGGIGDSAKVALGFLMRDVVQGTIGAASQFAAGAFQAVSGYERLEMSMQSLIAKEIARGQTHTETFQVVSQLTAKEQAQLQDLSLDYQQVNIDIQQQQEKMAGLAEKYGEGSLEFQEAAIRLQRLQGKLTDVSAEIEQLKSRNGQLVTATKEVTAGTMSMTEAMKLAGPKVKEVIQWMTTTAIKSPFSRDDVAQAYRTGLAYGFTSDQAQKLTGTIIDFAAATGQGGEVMGRILYALGQMHSAQKLNMQDVRQLLNAGVDVNSILKTMGFTLDDVGKKAIDSDKFIEALTQTLGEDFAGAAEKQATSFAGLTESLGDLSQQLLVSMGMPMFNAIKPALVGLTEMLTNPKIIEAADRMGGAIGGFMASVLPNAEQLASGAKFLTDVFGEFFYRLDQGKSPLDAVRWTLLRFLPPDLKANFNNFVSALEVAWQAVQNLWTQLQPTVNWLGGIFMDVLRRAGMFLDGFFKRIGGGQSPLDAFRDALLAALPPEAAQFLEDLEAKAIDLFTQVKEWALGFWESLQPIIQWFADNWQSILTFIGGLAGAFIGLNVVWPVVSAVAAFVSGVWAIGSAIGSIISALGIAGTAVAGLGSVLAVVNIPLVLITAAVALLAAAWVGNWGGIRDWTINFWNTTLQPMLGSLWQWLQVAVPAALKWLADTWTNVLEPAMKGVFEWIGANVMPLLSDLWDWLGTKLNDALTWLSDTWNNTLLPAITAVHDFWNEYLDPLVRAFADFLSAIFENRLKEITKQWNLMQPALETVWGWFEDVSEAVNSLWKGLTDNLEPILSVLFNLTFPQLALALDSLKKNWDDIVKVIQTATEWFHNVADAIRGVPATKGVGAIPDQATAVIPRASGGSVLNGKTYLVGEQGPELFIPKGSGTIVPNGALMGAGSVTNINLKPVQYAESDPVSLLTAVRKLQMLQV